LIDDNPIFYFAIRGFDENPTKTPGFVISKISLKQAKNNIPYSSNQSKTKDEIHVFQTHFLFNFSFLNFIV